MSDSNGTSSVVSTSASEGTPSVLSTSESACIACGSSSGQVRRLMPGNNILDGVSATVTDQRTSINSVHVRGSTNVTVGVQNIYNRPVIVKQMVLNDNYKWVPLEDEDDEAHLRAIGRDNV